MSIRLPDISAVVRILGGCHRGGALSDKRVGVNYTKGRLRPPFFSYEVACISKKKKRYLKLVTNPNQLKVFCMITKEACRKYLRKCAYADGGPFKAAPGIGLLAGLAGGGITGYMFTHPKDSALRKLAKVVAMSALGGVSGLGVGGVLKGAMIKEQEDAARHKRFNDAPEFAKLLMAVSGNM